MNIYPKAYVPTRTPPDSDGAGGERLHSCFGPVLWPGGEIPLRRDIRRPRKGEACRAIHEPIRPPVIVDRETERELRAPTVLDSIGRWQRRTPRPQELAS